VQDSIANGPAIVSAGHVHRAQSDVWNGASRECPTGAVAVEELAVIAASPYVDVRYNAYSL
jgi:hypothetical protein